MGLWDKIKKDFAAVKERDPAFKNKIELLYAYPGVWALVNYRIANAVYKKGFKRFARFIMSLSQFFTNIDIHPGATIGENVFIDHGIGVVIGETTVIGNNVTIYQGVTLGGVSLNPGKRHPTIEDDVTIGAGAKVLGNITVGKESRIGANSVVVKNVPPFSTVVGIPGKVIKRRDFTPLGHDRLPDIEKELFEYLMDRIKILEDAVTKGDKDIIQKDEEIEKKYRDYLEALKNK